MHDVLQMCGVTDDALAAAGMPAAEGRRLRHALVVYSSGFVSLLEELFGGFPDRSLLLQSVWNGYASLIESAEICGRDGVGHKSAPRLGPRAA